MLYLFKADAFKSEDLGVDPQFLEGGKGSLLLSGVGQLDTGRPPVVGTKYHQYFIPLAQ